PCKPSMKVLTLISSSNSGQVISFPSKAISNLLSCFKVAFLSRGNQAVGMLTERPSDKSTANTSLLHFKLSMVGYFWLIIANQNLEEQLKEAQERQKVQDDIAKMTQEKLKGYNASKGGQVLSPHNIKHLGLRNHPSLKCEDCKKPTLIFKDEANEHLLRILNDITSFKQGEELAADGENDPYSSQLKRNNAVLYGAPGTGKTEFINELVHHLYQQFASEEAKNLLQQIRELEEEMKEAEDPTPEQIQKLTELKKQITEIEENQLIPPVIEVKGAKLKSAGGITDQPSPDQKLISIIKHYKKEVFGDEFSSEPYIVFVEEADQGVDVMGGTG
ncbi:9308_t:CDS:2, partial [Cetraspora pellucida]